METPKASSDALETLDKKVARARAILIEMMMAGESGAVTIGYGPQGLRLAFERHEQPEKVTTLAVEECSGERSGYPRRERRAQVAYPDRQRR